MRCSLPGDREIILIEVRTTTNTDFLSAGWECGSPEPLMGYDKLKEERLWRAALPAGTTGYPLLRLDVMRPEPFLAQR